MPILHQTRPIPPNMPRAGEMLWRVQYTSSYYDDDPRGGGSVPVGAVAHVLAPSRDAAITKATSLPAFKKAKKDHDRGHDEALTATVATLEDLLPSEDARARHTGPGYLIARLRQVQLDHPDDQEDYRLAVCLVPKEKSP